MYSFFWSLGWKIRICNFKSWQTSLVAVTDATKLRLPTNKAPTTPHNLLKTLMFWSMLREKKNHCRLQSHSFQGLPVCKWTHPFRSFTHYLRRRWREGIWIKRSQRASHHWAPPVVCGVLFRLDRALCCLDWVLAKHLFIFLSFFPFILSLSPSSLWTEARVHLGLLYCATGKLPIRAPLWLNTESRSFIKKLICYSLPLTHCFSFSHSLLFFFSSTGSQCHTPASFLGLFSSSLYAVFSPSLL